MIERASVELIFDESSATVLGGGELDLNISSKLDEALAQAAARTNDITVDLREADFIDSAILASLVKSGKEMWKNNRRLRVQVISGSHPDYVLKTVGFGALMDIDVEQKTPQS